MDPEHAVDDRHLPVLASEARPIETLPSGVLSTPAAAAAGGFLAGIATFVLVRAMRARPGRFRLRRRRRQGGVERALEIAASRSFLVDVHVIKR